MMTVLNCNAATLYGMNIAKCPTCDKWISNIHYESHGPSAVSGYKGSQSFTAVAFPCGHAIGAVPRTWEERLDEIDRMTREIWQKVESINSEITRISGILQSIQKRTV